MNRRILITGGTGFIGSRVVIGLIRNGDTPIVIKRSSSNIWRIESILDKLIFYDIDRVTINDIFEREKIDGVINLATYYKKRDSYEDIEQMIDVNIKFPTKILELCKEKDIRIFITAGSYFQYKENINIYDNKASMNARNLYSATKNALDEIMKYYASHSKLTTINLVLFTPYGEMDHEEKVIPYIIRNALLNKSINLTAGFQKLNLVYVEDVANAFIQALEMLENNTERFLRINIANDNSYSIRDIVTIVENIIGKHLEVNWGDVKTEKMDEDKSIIVDTDTRERVLKWKPKTNIYEGISRTIAYYRRMINGN